MSDAEEYYSSVQTVCRKLRASKVTRLTLDMHAAASDKKKYPQVEFLTSKGAQVWEIGKKSRGEGGGRDSVEER